MAKRSVSILLTALSLLAIAPSKTLAQTGTLPADRPDQTESAVTVAPGHYQIESGVLISENDIGNVNITKTEILGTLVRIGMTPRVELRAGVEGFISRKVENPSGFGIRNEGFGNGLIGAKIRLNHSGDERTRMALLVESSIATGEGDVASDDWEPSFRLAAEKDLSSALQLGGNVGVADRDGDTVLLYSAAAAYGVNSTNGTFIEIFGSSDDDLSIDTGWTHLMSPRTQWDIVFGFGLTDEAPDWFAGLGLVVRLPE